MSDVALVTPKSEETWTLNQNRFDFGQIYKLLQSSDWNKLKHGRHFFQLLFSWIQLTSVQLLWEYTRSYFNLCCPFHYLSGGVSAKRPSAAPGTPPPTIAPGNESEAPTMMGSTPQNGENKPPQAIVEPQVLTHVIEGFVIKEGAEPFPVCVSAPDLCPTFIERDDKQPGEQHTLPCTCLQGAVSRKTHNPPLLLQAVTAHSSCLIQSLIIVRRVCGAGRVHMDGGVCVKRFIM